MVKKTKLKMNMRTTVCFIKRKQLPGYNSIEELFGNIISEIDKHLHIVTFPLQLSGAALPIMLRNIRSLKLKSDIYHITGDVHYMALALKKNTVLTIHDVNSARYGSVFKKLYIQFFWFWLPALFVKRITVISNFTKMELSKTIPFARHKIKVIPNPVSDKLSPEPYNFNAEEPRILLMGTKSNKNLERSLAALNDVRCKVIIIGNLSASQRNLLDSTKISFENHFNLSYDAIIDHYKRADLVCFPSTYEGFGMPIIEAQAVGRPVLTSTIGAMAEVAGNSAFLVNPFEVDSIKNGIMELLHNEALRKTLIEKGFENVKRFQTKHIAKQYMDLYDDMLKT